MPEAWRILLMIVPLVAGAIAIFFAFQLMKRYRSAFASSYFYYLVFLYIFGSYSLAGSGVLQHLLQKMDAETGVIHSAGLYAYLLGTPFMMLAAYMFLRSVHDLFHKKPSVVFTMAYFLVLISAILLYGLYVVRLSYFQQGDYESLKQGQRWVFLVFHILVYLLACLYIWRQSLRSRDRLLNKYARIFGYIYLAYIFLCTISLLLIPYYVIAEHIFLLVFLAAHLIPILFINIFLEKQKAREPLQTDSFEARLAQFAKDYEISKREKEVIILICQGLSNQEISEHLFISLQTVKDHIHRIFVKTGVKNRVQLNNMIR